MHPLSGLSRSEISIVRTPFITDEDEEQLRRANELPRMKVIGANAELMFKRLEAGTLQLWRVYGPDFKALMVTEVAHGCVHIFYLVGAGLRRHVVGMTEAMRELARGLGQRRVTACCADPIRARMFSMHPEAVVTWDGRRFNLKLEV